MLEMAQRSEQVPYYGALAQLGEHLLCKQGVIGSIPIGSTSFGYSRDEDICFAGQALAKPAFMRDLPASLTL